MSDIARPEDEPSAAARTAVRATGVYALLTRTANYALGVPLSVLIARALGAEGRGRYYVPLTAVTIGFYVFSAGVDQALFRLWGRRRVPAEQVTSAIGRLTVGLGLAGSIATFLTYELGRTSIFAGVSRPVMAIAVATLPLSIFNVVSRTQLTLSGETKLPNRAQAIAALAQTGTAVVLFAADALTVLNVVLLYALTVAVVTMLQAGALHRVLPAQHRADPALLRGLVASGIRLQPYSLSLFLSLRLDVFFVSHFHGRDGVGVYSIGVIFAELIWLVTDSLTFAIVERQANAGEDEALSVTLAAIRTNVLLALVLAAGVAVVAPLATDVLYGEEFAESVKVIWALLPGAVAMAMWRPAGAALLRLHPRTWVAPAVASGAVVVNVIGNVVLLPSVGVRGAAFASSVSYAVGAVATVAVLLRSTGTGAADVVPRAAEALP